MAQRALLTIRHPEVRAHAGKSDAACACLAAWRASKGDGPRYRGRSSFEALASLGHLRMTDRDSGRAVAQTTYDGIILGAGHNGLILQAYLGKAGLKTLAIDRRPIAGGGLSTLEDPRHPGFLHNTHAFFQRAITAMPWYGDLELARHGAHYIEPELNVALLTADGRALEWWTDPHKTDRVVCRLQPPRRRHAAALARRVRADRARHPGARGPLAAAADAGAARPAGAHQRRPAAARGERTVAAAIRRAGIRAPDDQGRSPVLQRTARGRPAAAGLRPSHRRPAGEPGQGADVARRLGGAGARARSARCAKRAARSG